MTVDVDGLDVVEDGACRRLGGAGLGGAAGDRDREGERPLQQIATTRDVIEEPPPAHAAGRAHQPASVHSPKNMRTTVVTVLVFGVAGPAIGAAVIWLERPPTSFGNVLALSYVFGGIPALIAGAAYGGLRARGYGCAFRWYTRALVGALAGLFGCLVFFVLVSGYDMLTVGDVDFRFFRRLAVAGIPAGTICALLVSPRQSVPGRCGPRQ